MQKPYKNILLAQLFHTTTSKSLNTGNPDKSTKTVPDNCYEDPEKTARTSKLKDQRNTLIETTYCFSVLSPDEKPTESMEKDSSLDGACERFIQIDDKYSSHRTTSYRKLIEFPEKIKFQ